MCKGESGALNSEFSEDPFLENGLDVEGCSVVSKGESGALSSEFSVDKIPLLKMCMILKDAQLWVRVRPGSRVLRSEFSVTKIPFLKMG